MKQALAGAVFMRDMERKMSACGHERTALDCWVCTAEQLERYEELCRSEVLMASGLMVMP